MLTQNWIVEFRGSGRANIYPIQETLLHTKSQFQEIVIAETLSYGRALFLDGVPQSAAIDEHVYHESLIHPALVANPQPKKVFIAGGGEGAVLREILKHNTIEKIVMVDIDDVLIKIVKEHLYEWHQGTFDDPRVEVVHADARAYLEQTEERFDCIFGDLPDPLEGGPAAELFTREFYALVKSRMNAGGVLALQTENTEIGWCKAHVAIINNLQHVFAHVQPYQSTIPFYGLPWGFAVASDAPFAERLNAQSVERILQERGCTDLSYYDAETHQHMFSLPRFLRSAYRDPEVAQKLQNALPLSIS
jgi:spermidine synthase